MKLEKKIGDLLQSRKWTLSIAESCTGGLISDRVTDVSGSSFYYEGGVVSYTRRAKAEHLLIPLAYIDKVGVVSPQMAGRMAQGVRKVFHTTFGLSTTGVAGPTGGTKKTPVGRVFIAVSDGKKTRVSKETFKGTRRTIKKEASERSLGLLYDFLLERSQSAWRKA
jgi:nicotinamide-nucleotide amidase